MLCMSTVYKELTVSPTPGTPNTHIFPNHHPFFFCQVQEMIRAIKLLIKHFKSDNTHLHN